MQQGMPSLRGARRALVRRRRYPGIPAVATRLEVGGGRLGVRLLGERDHARPLGAPRPPTVARPRCSRSAVLGVAPRSRSSPRGPRAPPRRPPSGIGELRLPVDHVVRREGADDHVVTVPVPEHRGGEADRRDGVARRGLGQQSVAGSVGSLAPTASGWRRPSRRRRRWAARGASRLQVACRSVRPDPVRSCKNLGAPARQWPQAGPGASCRHDGDEPGDPDPCCFLLHARRVPHDTLALPDAPPREGKVTPGPQATPARSSLD